MCSAYQKTIKIDSLPYKQYSSAFCLLKRHKNDGTDLSSNHLILALDLPAIELQIVCYWPSY